jgi:hypothetical protein
MFNILITRKFPEAKVTFGILSFIEGFIALFELIWFIVGENS